MNRRGVQVTLVGILLLGSAVAGAQETDRRFAGFGYKIGNGIGFLGADVIVRPVPHLSIDMQANYFQMTGNNGTARGYGLAPTAQLELRSVGHTPYLGIGYVYAYMALENVSASVKGAVFNLGYQWRFGNGLGVIVGGGVGYLGNARATDGVTTINQEGGWNPNLEAGVRYFF
jgi:hypothetical protein